MPRRIVFLIVLLALASPAYALMPGAQLPQVLRSAAPPQPQPPAPDATDPTITITGPTSSASYDNGTNPSVHISGTAGDNVGVASVTWTCATCTPTGAAAGGTTTFWSLDVIALSSGSNVIQVCATDGANNQACDSITVIYTPPMSGSCMAGGGSCVNSLSDTTPAIGQTITALGEDLHQETKAGWSARWVTQFPTAWSFEGSTFSSMGYAQPTNQTSATISTVKPLMGNQHGRFNNRTTNDTCGVSGLGIGSSQVNIQGPPQDVWLRYYQNFTYGSVGSALWPQGYMKNWELFGGSLYFQFRDGTPPGSTPAGFRLNGVATTPVTNQMFTFPTSVGTSFDMDRWYLYEIHAVSGAGGSVDWYVDGALIVSRTWSNVPAWNHFIGPLINACGTAPGGQSWDIIADIDGIAWGTQRIGASATIEVCNESTYAACTVKIYQPPRYISDTSVSFTFRKASPAASLNAGAGYVYITNNEGQTSAGFLIDIP